MAEEVIGSGFKQTVKEQLKVREETINSKNKEKNHLFFFNSNNAWVRLSSSVNTLSKVEMDFPANAVGFNTLANTNILKNGLTENQGQLEGGVDTTKGFRPTNNGKTDPPLEPKDKRTSTYHNYASLGFRPEPGIKSVSVKSKNTYGTIREAEINIVVWTLEDLELIQTLYLRPGYSVLLEWGHTLWLNPEDSSISSRIFNYNEFTEKRISQSGIYNTINEYRNKSSNNYDAMYGYVSNFNWTFRQDGGYDCTIKVISRGSILESLASTFEPSGRLEGTAFRYDDEDSEEGYIERISVFHKFAQEVGQANLVLVRGSSIGSTEKELDIKFATAFRKELLPYTSFNYKQRLDRSGWIWDDSVASTIVPLRTILDVFNTFATIVDTTTNNKQDKKLLRFYTGKSDKEPNKKQYEKESKFVTSPHHFSCDPMICVLPQPPKQLPGKFSEYKLGLVLRKDSIKHESLERSLTRGETDDILNIYVGLYPLLEKIQNAYESSKDPEKGFLPILQELLDQMSDVLGGVNEFDIHYDEDENMHFIVDRKKTPIEIEDTSKINLTGLKSTITNLSISSKISPEIANMVSIAAQGSSGNSKESVEAMLEWNQGLVDRHNPKKQVTNDSKREEERTSKGQKRLEDFLKKVDNVFQDFRVNDYDPNKFSELKSYHKEFCNEYVIGKYHEKDKTPVPGLIPIELSFDTIGIGGLKIGQAFTVSDGILPKKYTDNFGFLITGLDHNIQNNKWTTSIKTQFFPKRK